MGEQCRRRRDRLFLGHTGRRPCAYRRREPQGLIYGAHAAHRQFRAQGYGTLVNIGSIDSETPLALQNTYASTKAAVLSLSRSLNEELRLAGHDDIKVGTIMPWAVDTP